MTTVHSNTEPMIIQIDRIENGIARLLVHWNIQQVETSDQMTKDTRMEWQYSERVIKWTLPQKFGSFVDIEKYLAGIQDEILNWAEATDTFSAPVVNEGTREKYLEVVTKEELTLRYNEKSK